MTIRAHHTSKHIALALSAQEERFMSTSWHLPDLLSAGICISMEGPQDGLASHTQFWFLVGMPGTMHHALIQGRTDGLH